MMANHDVLIIGGGPGGYTAAIRAAQLGMNAACVDAESALGGTCLRVGCIPSKTFLHSTALYAQARDEFSGHGIQVSDVSFDLEAMHRRKQRVVRTLTKGIDYLFQKNNVTRYVGHATLLSPTQVQIVDNEEKQIVNSNRIVIATGSKPKPLLGIAGHMTRILSTTEALALEHVPAQLAVFGANYIGLEMASIWMRLGAEVTIIDSESHVLPGWDRDVADQLQGLLERQGMRFILGAHTFHVDEREDRVSVTAADNEPFTCDHAINALARAANTDELGLDGLGVQLDDDGFIQVDNQYETNVENVYAVGDVIGGPLLAHKAEKEGISCIEGMAGQPVTVNYHTIPAIVYTRPQAATVGFTEHQLETEGIPYTNGTFPLRANGRARTLEEADGMVKLLSHKNTDALLGAHIVSARAEDMIPELVAAISFGASAEDISLLTHAHPSVSETIKEAALAVDGRAIHG